MLQEGLARPPQSPSDILRQLVEDTLPGKAVDAALLDAVKSKHLRIQHRMNEHDSGRTLYVTHDIGTAAGYATAMSAHGGEFATDVHAALGTLGIKASPRFDGARPVMLEIKTPPESLLQQGGEPVQLDATRVSRYGYEQYIVDLPKVEVASVTFAAKNSQGNWSFAGQPALSPQQALAEIAESFRDRQHFRPDPEKTEILKTVYSAQDMQGARLPLRTSGTVTELQMRLPDGTMEKLRIPDPDFKPAAAKLAGKHFEGHEQKYKLPHGLEPKEIDAYLNVLAIKDQRGDIKPDVRMTALQGLAGKLQAENPSLQGLQLSKENPNQLEGLLRGAAHGFKPVDIQAQLAETPLGAKPATLIGLLSWPNAGFRVSAATRATLGQQLEAKIPPPPAAVPERKF